MEQFDVAFGSGMLLGRLLDHVPGLEAYGVDATSFWTRVMAGELTLSRSPRTCMPLYTLNFFSTLLSDTALMATVIELALMAKAPTSGLSRIPKG
jgi:hypothetical protein